MTKEEIINKIISCENDDELKSFLQSRINELEEESGERTVGQGHTVTFREYISSKTHYKPAASIGKKPCPDLVYDDYTPYFELLKKIHKMGIDYAEEVFFFNPIMQEISNYIFDGNKSIDEYDRHMIYFSAAYRGEKTVSISQFKHKSCALCSERSGMAHNMFKILGMNSEVVIGTRNNEPHAYNLIFPKGYENIPAVLVDFSNPAKCESKSSHKVYDLPYYKVLSEEEYYSLMEGNPISINATKSITHLLNYFKTLNAIEQDCTLTTEEVTYSAQKDTIIKSKSRFQF